MLSQVPEDDERKLVHLKAHGKSVSFFIDEPSDHIQGTIFKTHGFYEQDLLEAVFHRVLPGMRFVDVGANIGNHTLFFSGVLGMEGASIGPFGPNFQRLQENIKLNTLADKVQALNICLGAEPGHAALTKIDKANTGTATFSTNEEGTITVQPLDALELGPFHLLKIDVEGMEKEVLRGCGESLRKYRPIVFCEAQTAEDFYAVKSILDAFGYRPTRRYCVTPTYLFEPV